MTKLSNAFEIIENVWHGANEKINRTCIVYVGDEIEHEPIEELIIPETYEGKTIDCLNLGWYLPKSLKRIHLSKNISYIWGKSFGTSIEKISIDPENPYFSTDGIGIYSKDGTKFICLANQGLDEYYVQEGTKVICEKAFEGSKELKKVILPKSIYELENYAFSSDIYFCENLKEIIGLENITKIGKFVFQGTKFERENDIITVNSGKILVRKRIIDSLEHLIPEGTEEISEYCFDKLKDDYLVEDIVLPNTLKRIKPWALSGLKSVEEITIPASLIDIAPSAFPSVLKKIYVDEKNPIYCVIDNILCLKESGLKVYTPEGKPLNRRSSKTIADVKYNIVDGVLTGYSGVLGNDIVLPDGLHTIGAKAFYGENNIFSIAIPEGVKKIEDSSFANCMNLEVVSLPNTLESIGKSAFKNTMIQEIITPESLKTIGEQAFNGSSLYKISISHSVRKIGKGALGGYPMCLEEIYNYSKLPILSLDIWGEKWEKEMIFQFCKDGYFPNEILEGLSTDAQRMAVFAFCKHVDLYTEQEQEKFFNFIKHHRKSLINAINKKDIDISEKKQIIAVLEKKPVFKQQKEKSVPEDENEYSKDLKDAISLIKENLNESKLAKSWSKIGGNEIGAVKLKDGTDDAPSILIQCSIIPYSEQTTSPKSTKDFEKTISPIKLVEIAELAYSFLDKDSLSKAIASLCAKFEKDTMWLIPWAHYAVGKDLDVLLKKMKSTWPKGNAPGKKKVVIAKAGLLLNESRAAALYFESIGCLNHYAAIRGKKAEDIRETSLCEFGFNDSGCKVYDLGKTKIRLQYNEDGTLSLYDNETSIELKSIPAKGGDKTKVALAKADYEDIKRNVNTVVSVKKDLLFTWYLDEMLNLAPDKWKHSYMNNPVLKTFAKSLVWSQGDATFIANENMELITSKGQPYAISDKKVSVAHVFDMADNEIEKWRDYFEKNAIVQPFEQIMENKYDLSQIESNRYASCYIPQYRFMNAEKHGISFVYGNPYEGIQNSIHLKDIDVESQYDYYYDESSEDVNVVNGYEAFVLFDINIKNKTRKVNHIIHLLDEWTSRQRKNVEEQTEIVPLVVKVFNFIKNTLRNTIVRKEDIMENFKDENQEEIEACLKELIEKGAIATYETVVGDLYATLV